MFVSSVRSIEFGGVRHVSTVLPVILFSVMSIYSVVNIQRRNLLLFSYSILFAGVVSCIYNSEIRSLLSLYIFLIPVITIYQLKIHIPYKLLKIMFWLSVVICIISYHIGVNEWGYLPGQALGNATGQSWRVSLFPLSVPVYSGVFALIVLISSILNNKSNSVLRYATSILAFYFVILSGSRSTYIVIMLASILFLLSRIDFTLTLYVLPLAAIVSIYIVMLLPWLLLSYDTPTLVNYIIYRSPDPLPMSEMESLARLQLANNLLSIYSTSPIFGVGSFDLLSRFPNAPSYSESKWLSLLARYGITMVILFSFFYWKYIRAIKTQSWYCMGFTLSIIIYGMFYGSFFNTYHVLFLLLISESTRRNKTVVSNNP